MAHGISVHNLLGKLSRNHLFERGFQYNLGIDFSGLVVQIYYPEIRQDWSLSPLSSCLLDMVPDESLIGSVWVIVGSFTSIGYRMLPS